MQIERVMALPGPNLWSRRPLLRAWLNLGSAARSTQDDITGAVSRLLSAVSALGTPSSAEGLEGARWELGRADSAWLVVLNLTLLLQTLLHRGLGFGTGWVSESGACELLVECGEGDFAVACLDVAVCLTLTALRGQLGPLRGELERLRNLADKVCLGPSTQAIVSAAANRGIPAIRLSTNNLVQLGYGACQQRIWTAETQRTSAVAEAIAQDKNLTRQLLASVGVPVPRGRKVDSADDAWRAAQELTGEVVVKPTDANHARGVSACVSGQAATRAAYALALAEGSGVLVEQFIVGRQYRVLVVGDRAVAASEGVPEQLIGDGVRNVSELVADCNRDPARGEASALTRSPLVLDEISLGVLARQQLTAESIPRHGEVVLFRHDGDLISDVTEQLHPDVADDCVLAAQAVGLDVAGIDLIAQRVDVPLQRSGGAILEVNASPGLVMHLRPLSGRPQPVGEAIVEHIFRGADAPRLPIVVALNADAAHSLERLAALLAMRGHSVGRADRTGVYVGTQRLSQDDCRNFAAGRRILVNPFVQIALFELSPDAGATEALPFDYCTLVILPPPTSESATSSGLTGTVLGLLTTEGCVVVDEGPGDAEAGLAARSWASDQAMVALERAFAEQVVSKEPPRGERG